MVKVFTRRQEKRAVNTQNQTCGRRASINSFIRSNFGGFELSSNVKVSRTGRLDCQRGCTGRWVGVSAVDYYIVPFSCCIVQWRAITTRTIPWRVIPSVPHGKAALVQ